MAQEFELKFKKLKEREKEELAVLKERRIKHEEMIKKESDRKAEDKLLAALKKEKEKLITDLESMKKRSFALQIKKDSWENVQKKALWDLKENEKILNDKLEAIWKAREFFCDETGKYIEEYGISSKWWKEQMNLVNNPHLLQQVHMEKKKAKLNKVVNEKIIFDLNKDIEELQCKIEKEEKEKENNDFLIKELETEKQYLLQETNLGEFKRIRENLESVNKRCSELTKLISERQKPNILGNPSEPNFEAENWFTNENPDVAVNNKTADLREKTNLMFCSEWFNFQNTSFSSFNSEVINGSTENHMEQGETFSHSPHPVESDFLTENPTSKRSDVEMLCDGRVGNLFADPDPTEKAEVNTSGAEDPKPDSFLFEMLDPTAIKAAKANAKSRRLSSMRAQERNRHLRISFSNFLSGMQD